jgi:hypothetical protein
MAMKKRLFTAGAASGHGLGLFHEGKPARIVGREGLDLLDGSADQRKAEQRGGVVVQNLA